MTAHSGGLRRSKGKRTPRIFPNLGALRGHRTISVSLSTFFSSAFFKLPRWIFDLFVFYSMEGKLPAEEGEAQRGMACPRSRGALLARAVLWLHVAWRCGPAQVTFKLQCMTNGMGGKERRRGKGSLFFCVRLRSPIWGNLPSGQDAS